MCWRMRPSGREIMEALPFPSDNDPEKTRATAIRCALAEVSLAGDFAQFGGEGCFAGWSADTRRGSAMPFPTL